MKKTEEGLDDFATKLRSYEKLLGQKTEAEVALAKVDALLGAARQELMHFAGATLTAQKLFAPPKRRGKGKKTKAKEAAVAKGSKFPLPHASGISWAAEEAALKIRLQKEDQRSVKSLLRLRKALRMLGGTAGIHDLVKKIGVNASAVHSQIVRAKQLGLVKRISRGTYTITNS